ncbi:MAG: O-methyltransferase [Aureispira sp.]|nr:O-methyltransferase [Aureispira sp.]
MDFLPKDVSKYAEEHTNVFDSEVLGALERKTHLEVLMPQMLSGFLQGQFLSFFSRMLKPKCILEIGTFTGYSAICLAEGLQDGGVLHTIDINEELKETTDAFFAKAGLTDVVRYHIGNAMEIVPKLEETLDLVFIDADKVNYSNYCDLILPKLKVGGYIIADNVLWSGQVFAAKQDKKAEALNIFNKKVQNDPRVKNMLLPIRDGLMLIEKL